MWAALAHRTSAHRGPTRVCHVDVEVREDTLLFSSVLEQSREHLPIACTHSCACVIFVGVHTGRLNHKKERNTFKMLLFVLL